MTKTTVGALHETPAAPPPELSIAAAPMQASPIKRLLADLKDGFSGSYSDLTGLRGLATMAAIGSTMIVSMTAFDAYGGAEAVKDFAKQSATQIQSNFSAMKGFDFQSSTKELATRTSTLGLRALESFEAATPSEKIMVSAAAVASAPIVVPMAMGAAVGAAAMALPIAVATASMSLPVAAAKVSSGVPELIESQAKETGQNFSRLKDFSSQAYKQLSDAVPGVPSVGVKQAAAAAAVAVAAPVVVPLATVAAVGVAAYGALQVATGHKEEFKQDIQAVAEKLKGFSPITGLLATLSAPAPSQNAKPKLGWSSSSPH